MSTEQRLVLSRLQSDQPDVQGAGTSVEISASDCPVLLGRGPLLQIADTRVSRKQGQIEWMGHAEQWRLVSNKSMLIAAISKAQKDFPLDNRIFHFWLCCWDGQRCRY